MEPKTFASLFFGTYPQEDEERKTPIEWLILDENEDKALLISKLILDYQPYDHPGKGATWETSYIRQWLNSVFLQTAFTAEEQQMILETTITGRTGYYKPYRYKTQDRVFLLNVLEVNLYFGSTYRAKRSKGTAHSYLQGLNKHDSGNSYWLLRGTDKGDLMIKPCVAWNGCPTSGYGTESLAQKEGIRPAIWIDMRKYVN